MWYAVWKNGDFTRIGHQSVKTDVGGCSRLAASARPARSAAMAISMVVTCRLAVCMSSLVSCLHRVSSTTVAMASASVLGGCESAGNERSVEAMENGSPAGQDLRICGKFQCFVLICPCTAGGNMRGKGILVIVAGCKP